MSRTIRALLVDDEPIARRRLRRLLADESDVEVVGECADADAAAELLAARPVDLLLLDIQMPGGDGFSLLERLRSAGRPAPLVVFVTAFDEHAVRAFEVAAVDYLVKPFARGRVAEAVARARRQLAAGGPPALDAAALEALVARVHPGESYRTRILVRSIGRVSFVPVDQIRWIEADGNYVRLHTAQGRHLARETMARLVRELDPARFVRVHRGAIVALDHVRELERSPTGDHTLVLDAGTRLTLSRSHREAFERAVEGRPGLATA
jgi:two-component system LytT family response regulator